MLKYLAVLRWKLQVDIPTVLPAPEGQPSFPTPHSNGDSYSPASGPKGKGKMTDDDVKISMRGKVTDAKRIAEYMKHQNDQHDMAVSHVRHTATNIGTLRSVAMITSFKL
jgi:mediator of RNA polymerase II transcription subunit 14